MSAIMTMASISMIFTDCLSVPKIIGNGPMRITPPPFIFPLFLLAERASRKVVTMMIMSPMTINKKPINPKASQSDNSFAKDRHGKVEIIKV